MVSDQNKIRGYKQRLLRKNNIYHLQQKVWILLLEHLNKENPEDFEEIIQRSLMLDNATFMENVLKIIKNEFPF